MRATKKQKEHIKMSTETKSKMKRQEGNTSRHTMPETKKREKNTKRAYQNEYRNKIQDEETRRKYQQTYYARNKEERKEYKKVYYSKTQDVQKEYQRRYHSEHVEEKRAYRKKYDSENRDAKKEYFQDYHKKNRSRLLEAQKEYNQRYQLEKMEETQKLVEKHAADIRTELESRFSISQAKSWYSITRKQFYSSNSELSEVTKAAMKLPFLNLLKILYPLENWKSSALLNVPQDTWKDPKKTRDFLEALEPSLFISKKEDWYYVGLKHLKLVGAGSCLSHFSNRIANMLQFGFPEIAWDPKMFSNRRKQASQRWLFQLATQLFQGKEIIYNYRFNPADGETILATNMEFDIWLPELRIAMEYQGEHHYHNFDTFIGGNLTRASLHQTRDDNKRAFCLRESIKLIEVPYWWDGSQESLLQIIEWQIN
eukprot:TRINITY_DN2768_c0_g1_i1.p1 TRINITY_DN2768_c0_g1~~TRINITY_DN2768_c0_g1_i1.p1  ORF type:complete len:426 (-),score=84.35 TRINITY_DN2768_c0_g1_i1:1313-2590(-)